MAFNSADTRQRAYNRIDTSSPHGNWIDEKAYNKRGTAGAHGARTLVGNWQEETVLEVDMSANGHEMSTLRQRGKYLTGGFESTAYLLSPLEQSDRVADHQTTQRVSYNEVNANVATQKKAPLGVRSHLRAQMIIEDATTKVKEASRRTVPAPVHSTYRETIGGLTESRTPVDESVLEARYVKEVPITIYTGNPQSGAQMVIPGRSSECGAGNPLGKNTSFSHGKYTLGMIA